MFMGNPTKIYSAFHLGYNMLLNLMRVEGADPDYMIQRSFHQFQKDRAALIINEQKKDVEIELESVDELQSAVKDDTEYPFNVDETMADYYYLTKELQHKREELRVILIKPENIVPFLSPGRLIYVQDGEVDWGWGILITANQRKIVIEPVDGSVFEEDSEPQWVLDIFFPCEPGSVESGCPRPAIKGSSGKVEGHVLPMPLSLVHRISKIRSNMPEGDPKSEESGRAFIKTLNTIKKHKKFKTGIPELEPVSEMNILAEDVEPILESLKDIEAKRNENAFTGQSRLDEYYAAFDKKVKLHAKLQELDKSINQSRFMVMNDDLRAMRRVLRRLDFIDQDGVVLMKGRMACEISAADEVLMTEIVFQNVFADMESDDIIALCSCLIFDEKCEDPIPHNLELVNAFNIVKGIARNIAEVMREHKIPIDVNEFVSKLKPQLMEVILSWLQGRRFFEIMNQCNLYEGTVVRVIRRLEELVRELATAAKIIGNKELEEKLNQGRSRLKRGIIFAASLYL